MDFWSIILIITAITGLLGFWRVPFWNGMLLFCDWKDGNDIDWGVEMFSMLVGPFAYLFAIFEIILIFHNRT